MGGKDRRAEVAFFNSLREQAGDSAVAIARRLLNWVRRFPSVDLDFGKGGDVVARPKVRTGGAGTKTIGYPKPFVIRPMGQIEIDLKSFASNRPAFPRAAYLHLLVQASIAEVSAHDDQPLLFALSSIDTDAKFKALQEAVEWCVNTLSEMEG